MNYSCLFISIIDYYISHHQLPVYMTILVLLNLVTLFVNCQIISSFLNYTQNNLPQSNIQPIDPFIASLFAPQFLAAHLIDSITELKINVEVGDDKTNQENEKIRFRSYQKRFKKKYHKDEILFRFKIFIENENEINRQNSQTQNYTLGINKFADLTKEQFLKIYLMKPTELQMPVMAAPPKSSFSDQLAFNQKSASPNRILYQNNTIKSIDYRKLIKFSEVKDQGGCGACYAFANIAAIQLNWAYQYKQPQPNLSQQQIIDCCKQYGFKCDGCTTGNMGSSLDYLQKVGIALTENYPYKKTTSKCMLNFKKKNYLRLKDDSYEQIRGVEALKYYLFNKGPVSVAIYSQVWKFYQQGVFNRCPSSNLIFDHAVSVIGVDQNGTWIIRNSWGWDWGQKGYLRLSSGNSCGLTDYVFYPLII